MIKLDKNNKCRNYLIRIKKNIKYNYKNYNKK